MIIDGIDSISRERCFTWGRSYQLDKKFGQALRQESAAKEFLSKYEFGANLGTILTAIRTLNPDENEPTTISKFVAALELVMRRPGILVKKAAVEPDEPEPTEEEAPQPPAHHGQQMWREHAEFMEHGGKDGGIPSGGEVRAHMRESKSFLAFITKGYQERMASEIGGAGTVLNAPVASSDAEPSPQLLAWVAEYRTTPMEKVRQRMRADFNPSGFREYNRNFEAAVAAGLI